MTAKHTIIRETMLLPSPAPFPKILCPNLTPIPPRKTIRNQTKLNESWTIGTQLSTKIRMRYWHTTPPAGHPIKNPVRMNFCDSGVCRRRNNGTSLAFIGDRKGEAVTAVRIEKPSSSRMQTRIRLHRWAGGMRGWMRVSKKEQISEYLFVFSGVGERVWSSCCTVLSIDSHKKLVIYDQVVLHRIQCINA